LEGIVGVRVIYRAQEWELKGRTTVRRAIKKVGLRPGDVLPVLNGKLVTEDQTVKRDDTLELIAVVSGG